jgi:hypothetical protein
LNKVVQDGWPETRSETPIAVRPYWNYRDEIVNHDGILLKGERIIIPEVMRGETLKCIHAAHLGIEKCKARARDVLF